MAAFPILTLAAPAAANEGNSGNTQFRFVVTRSGLTTSACSCSWALTGTVAADDLAAGQATSGTVSFAAGVTTQNIDINVAGDTDEESDETITITLTNPSGCVLVKQPANGTVAVDDSYRVTYTPNSGFTGTETFNYTVRDSTNATLTADISVTVNSTTPPPTGFSHVASITLPAWGTALPTVSNFLLPLAVSHNDLRTVANGGKVQHASGFDIQFQTSTGTKLAHKDIYYDGEYGVVVKLVNMPRNFSAAETIKMFIGKSGLSVSEEDVTNARAGGWLAIYAGNSGADRTGNSRTLTASGSPPTTTIYLWPAANLNGSSQYYASSGTISYMNALSALSVVSYHRALGTGDRYEVFNVGTASEDQLTIYMGDGTNERMNFAVKYGSTVYTYQSANNRQSIDGQAIAVATQAGQAIRLAINGTLDSPGSAATIAASTTTSISDNLEWGRGGRGSYEYWDGDVAFLGFCSTALPTAALESMTAAFADPDRVYTLGSFAAVT